jgi:hypothetical protein
MKKSLIIILLFIFISYSCDKYPPQTYCWTCITTQITSGKGITTQTTKITTTPCNLSDADTQKYEEQNTTMATSTVTVGNIIAYATITSTCKCTIKN